MIWPADDSEWTSVIWFQVMLSSMATIKLVMNVSFSADLRTSKPKHPPSFVVSLREPLHLVILLLERCRVVLRTFVMN